MAVDKMLVGLDVNLAALKNPQDFIDGIIDRCKANVNVMLPCRVERYDRATHLADLRVMFNWKMRDGTLFEGCLLKDITIRRLLAGNFLIDFPIAIGDTGWIFACDRDAYDVKKERAQRLPSSTAENSFASGFWFPDQWGSDTELSISGVDQNRLVIQSKDGTQKISVGANDIHITATTVNITAPNTNISGDVHIGGKLDVVGNIKETTADVTLSTHKHTSDGPSPVPGT